MQPMPPVNTVEHVLIHLEVITVSVPPAGVVLIVQSVPTSVCSHHVAMEAPVKTPSILSCVIVLLDSQGPGVK